MLITGRWPHITVGAEAGTAGDRVEHLHRSVVEVVVVVVESLRAMCGAGTTPVADLISVVVCTRERPGPLARALRSLAALDDPAFEVVVVDNHAEPTVSQAAGSALGPLVRFVHEPHRGLNRARAAGIEAAHGSVVAFTDDDCEVTPGWLSALRAAFAAPDVGCVTGRVRPARVDGATHRWFEARFSFDRGPLPLRFTRHDRHLPWFPTYPSAMGTGANMAFRRELLESIPGFDPALDVGTRVGGGGDLDVFAQVMDADAVAVYAPDALVLHHHRDRRGALARQFFGYGKTVGALATKYALYRDGERRNAVRFFRWYLGDQLRRVGRGLRRRGDVPLYLTLLEFAGNLTGPFAYLSSDRSGTRRSPSGDPCGLPRTGRAA